MKFLQQIFCLKVEDPADPNFENILNVGSANNLQDGESDSLDVIDEIEDEGISDISTHETIINPSSGNDKYGLSFINIVMMLIN